MKKHFSKFLSLTIGVVMLVSLSVAAYADKPAAEPYTPTAETTLGDICRHFEPEWFASLPADIQSQYDETLLNDVSGKKACITNNEERATVGWASVHVNAYGKKEAIEYVAALEVDISCPSVILTAVAYDNETGDIIDTDSAYDTVSVGVSFRNTCEDLEPDHEYRVDALGMVTPPAGCTIDGLMDDTDIVTTR